MTDRTAPAKEAEADEQNLKWAIERAYLLEEEFQGKHTATGNNDAKAIRLMLAAIGSVEQSRRSSPVREGDGGQATPKTAPHPSRAASDGWRSMDSAPKDGPILLFARESCYVGQWQTDRYAKKPRPYWHYSDVWRVSGCRAIPPTHWMPLPSSPGANEMGASGAEGDQASPSSADLSRVSDAPSVTAKYTDKELAGFIINGVKADEAPGAINGKNSFLYRISVAYLAAMESLSQMAQSNDHARAAEAAEVGAILLRMAEDINFTEDEQITFRIAARLLASPSEPSGRGESEGIQGPSSDVVQNTGEQK